MPDIAAFILSKAAYIWLSLSLIFVFLEGVFGLNLFLWLGFAAFVTGLFEYFLTDLPIMATGVIFVIFSILFLLLGRRYVKISIAPPSGNPNEKARRMIGRRGAAIHDAPNGLSQIQIDQANWPVRLENNAAIQAGHVLEITSFDGTTLVAKLLDI